MHIRGAVNLSFPEIAIESLKATIPDRKTRMYERGPLIDQRTRSWSSPAASN
ncbi:MAG: hypothetical protein M3041_21335 [Acidobacteriota bacterium]|nr:hypothetical protein [Acidobacteriota bacterium]